MHIEDITGPDKDAEDEIMRRLDADIKRMEGPALSGLPGPEDMDRPNHKDGTSAVVGATAASGTAKAAAKTGKSTRISIRIADGVLAAYRSEAARMGIGYQTLIKVALDRGLSTAGPH